MPLGTKHESRRSRCQWSDLRRPMRVVSPALELSVSLIEMKPQAHTAQMLVNAASGELLIIERLTLE